MLVYLASSFWLGAVHAATPGHGKTIAAAYIVGVRGRPIDAVVLGMFVTLSHVSGIVAVGLIASLGLPGVMPQRLEAWLALATGVLVIVIGLWTLWTQRGLVRQLREKTAATGDPGTLRYVPTHAAAGAMATRSTRGGHGHGHGPGHAHHHHDGHDHEGGGWHSHGWGFKHTHDLGLVTRANRPGFWMLVGLGVAGGLLPDPAALAILLNALSQGRVMLGLATVVVFSVGFAATLTIVGIVAAKVGQRIFEWLAGAWALRLQIGTSLLIVLVGVVLTVQAAGRFAGSGQA